MEWIIQMYHGHIILSKHLLAGCTWIARCTWIAGCSWIARCTWFAGCTFTFPVVRFCFLDSSEGVRSFRITQNVWFLLFHTKESELSRSALFNCEYFSRLIPPRFKGICVPAWTLHMRWEQTTYIEPECLLNI